MTMTLTTSPAKKVSSTGTQLPRGSALQALLGLSDADEAVLDVVHQVLTHPVEHFLNRPGKGLRAEAVQVAFLLLQDSSLLSVAEGEQCRVASDILELIHAGSLVVDDIEDNSDVRRGEPTLHKQFGLPVALNAGNWLYFFPFERLRELKLSSRRELRVYQECHRTLLRAHYGQALDVGAQLAKLPQRDVYAVCRAAIELKSGALMQLAFQLGGLLALDQILGDTDAPDEAEARVRALGAFGFRFGTCLQMLNDIGNLTSDANGTKQKEDLRLQRPSWLWAIAARHLDADRYRDFLHMVDGAVHSKGVDAFIHMSGITQTARHTALDELEAAFDELSNAFSDQIATLQPIDNLIRKLTRAYE